MGLSFRTRARTDFSTNTKTKHAIKQLLTTRNKLVHGDIPYAVKGMEGMKIRLIDWWIIRTNLEHRNTT